MNPTITTPVIRADVRGFILVNFLPGDSEDSLDDEDLLLEGGIIDSGSVMSLVAFLEDRFGIRVEDGDLVTEHFASVAAITAFVARKAGSACVSC